MHLFIFCRPRKVAVDRDREATVREGDHRRPIRRPADAAVPAQSRDPETVRAPHLDKVNFAGSGVWRPTKCDYSVLPILQTKLNDYPPFYDSKKQPQTLPTNLFWPHVVVAASNPAPFTFCYLPKIFHTPPLTLTDLPKSLQPESNFSSRLRLVSSEFARPFFYLFSHSNDETHSNANLTHVYQIVSKLGKREQQALRRLDHLKSVPFRSDPFIKGNPFVHPPPFNNTHLLSTITSLRIHSRGGRPSHFPPVSHTHKPTQEYSVTVLLFCAEVFQFF